VSELTTPAANIMAVLNDMRGGFCDGTTGNVRELVEHDEPGVALQVLCAQLFECGIKLSNLNLSRLTTVARLMGIPLSDLDGLADYARRRSQTGFAEIGPPADPAEMARPAGFAKH
jgi:hypothetical protein